MEMCLFNGIIRWTLIILGWDLNVHGVMENGTLANLKRVTVLITNKTTSLSLSNWIG